MSRTLGANRKHAIVLGGSMAGLLASRVLSDHFERVTLIERDALPARAEQRRGVAQGRHTHGLLGSRRQCVARDQGDAFEMSGQYARSAAESALFPGGKPRLTRNRRSDEKG